ncbi:hypothetical protein RFI_13313 [Reticulomyxa filosa]|uniref:Uncharacterized protein n=1 Tax=Reticulomyxa filosa TaxID=46433 RepID=X6NDL9_RETFI|nr:hypothetical protein RFI_13313 [Reticulomyxa filosa]|eukprot:ETO23854.1 hypothetical protein RFI_13313 [Reticulomyxa filosa]
MSLRIYDQKRDEHSKYRSKGKDSKVTFASIFTFKGQRGGMYSGRFGEKLQISVIYENGKHYKQEILGELYTNGSFTKGYQCDKMTKYYICKKDNAWNKPSVMYSDVTRHWNVMITLPQTDIKSGPKTFQRYGLCGALFVDEARDHEGKTVTQHVIRIHAPTSEKKWVEQCVVQFQINNKINLSCIKEITISNSEKTFFNWAKVRIKFSFFLSFF